MFRNVVTDTEQGGREGTDRYPTSLSAWNLPGDFASGVDAALEGIGSYDGKAYFFRGDKYVCYDGAANDVDPATRPA